MRRPQDHLPTFEDIPHAVQWHEGMLLVPQHFQQQALRNEAQLHYHLRQVSPFHWGVKRLAYDRGILENKGVFRVGVLEAVMPDGLAVGFDPAIHGRLELELDATHKAALAQGPQCIYLVLLGDKRGATGSEGLSSRYQGVQSAPLYDNGGGELPQRIEQLVPWLRLHFGRPRDVDCALPLVELSRRVEGAPFSVSDYVAPRLDVPVDSTLGKLCGEVSGRLCKKIDYLGREAVPARGSEVEHERNQWLLAHLITGLPAYEAIWRSGLCHPFTVYLALCALAGQVAAVARKLPNLLDYYQHDDLQGCFKEVTLFIQQTLEEAVPESFLVHTFRQTQQGFELPFREEWLDQRLVLGVVGPELASPSEVKDWVRDCHVGGKGEMRAMRDKRTVGVRREPLDFCPGLAPWGRMLLFEFKREGQEDLLAFHTGKETVLCLEQGGPQESSPAQVVLFTERPLASKKPGAGRAR
ncbi:type VI secretion system baseplate subunit TssK [Corallococcus sp. BB11-1]|uniref:type VI secretion system baseplate subunit TssK n=1 Tax=Corallococcus sp. BB11-1 TaxID=2996783 RepID=UPI00226EE1F9|nr:type VI secretion system baseplate subunit TssK [Corallococcus sp. BB11-1]MCY1033891.1 type VI secretion system baseplate subunit TssK [Corallococcus sp. BB11-1]